MLLAKKANLVLGILNAYANPIYLGGWRREVYGFKD